MAVGDILQATVVQSLQGQQILNVLHYQVKTVGTGTAEILLAQDLGERLAPAMKSLMSQDWAYVSTIGQKVFPRPPSFPYIDSTDAGIGSIPSGALPAQNTLNLTKTTQFAGTKWRGRVCLSGLAEASSTGGEWENTALTAAAPIAAALTSDITTGGWVLTPVLWHREDGTATPLTGIIARKTIRAQRRRQVGKGS